MKNIVFVLLLFLISLPSIAIANVSINIDKNPSVGENFTLTISAPSNVLPRGGYDTPVVAKNDSYQILGTKEGRDRDFFGRNFTTFNFKIKALSGGTLKVGPISWVVGGKTHNLGTKDVRVERGLDQPGLSVWVGANKKKLYVGEQTRLSIQYTVFENYNDGLDATTFSFGKEFIGGLHKESFTQKASNKDYVRATVHQMAYISPLQEGKLSVQKNKFNYEKKGEMKTITESGGNKFSQWSKSKTEQEVIKSQAYSNPINFEVLPLPTKGKPNKFNGMVGQFTMNLKASHDTLELGDALTLKLSLRGNGKPGYLPSPQIPIFENFREIPPEKSKSNFYNQGYMWTELKQKFYLYPKKQGLLTIPPFQFDFFDPKQERYIRLKTDTINLFVKPPKLGLESTSEDFRKLSPVANEIVKVNDKELKYLRLNPTAFTKVNNPVYKNKFLYIAWGVVCLLLALSYLYSYTSVFKSNKTDKESDSAQINKIEKKLQVLLDQQNLKEFMESIKFLADKKSESSSKLKRAWDDMIAECDFKLYASSNISTAECKDLLSKYNDLKLLEKEEKNK